MQPVPCPVPLVAYTDGGCRGNPGIGGWGYLLIHLPTNVALEARGGAAQTTNNRMEMLAAIEALRSLKRPGQAIEIRSDSKYLVDMATKWMGGWKRKGWKRKGKAPIKNLDLVKELDALLQKHDVSWRWVKGHAGEPGNEFADQLTNDAMDAQQLGMGAAARRRHPVSPLQVPRED